MKKYISLLLVAFTVLVAGNAIAFVPPPKPDHGWYIQDTANKLSQKDKDTLNKKIDGINKTSKNEIGIAIVPTLGDDNLDDATKDTFHTWGIGKKELDNGVLIFVAVAEHKVRIETGKGAEGDLPDLKCQDIIKQMLPLFKKGDFVGALNVGVDQTSGGMESRAVDVPVAPVVKKVAAKQKEQSSSGALIFILLLVAVGGAGFVYYLYMRRKQEEEYYRYEMGGAFGPGPISGPDPTKKAAIYVPPNHSNFIKDAVAVGGAAGFIGAGLATSSAIEQKRKRQKDADAARKLRDSKRRKDEAPPASTYTTPTVIGGYYDSGNSDSSNSSDSGSSYDSGSSDGGGFGGGDSGGGGSDGSWD